MLACSASKERPGPFLLLSPAERAAISSTFRPESLVPPPQGSTAVSQSPSRTSSDDMSDISAQDAAPLRPDTAYVPDADMAPAGLGCCPSGQEMASPFSSICIEEDDDRDALRRCLGSGQAVREEVRGMRTADSVPEGAATAPMTQRAVPLDERFIQKSLSADTASLPAGDQALRDTLRAALVPSLVAATRSAARSTGSLCAMLEPQKASGQVVGDGESDQLVTPAQRSGSTSRAPSRGNSFSRGKKAVICCEDVEALKRSSSWDWSDPSSENSPPRPKSAQRTSLDDLKQAQLALASFPGNLTESQASAVAGVRSRMRGLAQEQPARGSEQLGSSSGMVWDAQSSGSIQRLSLVVGNWQQRSASADPAEYCSADRHPFESAASLSLPEDFIAGTLNPEGGTGTTVASGGMSEQTAPQSQTPVQNMRESIAHAAETQMRWRMVQGLPPLGDAQGPSLATQGPTASGQEPAEAPEVGDSAARTAQSPAAVAGAAGPNSKKRGAAPVLLPLSFSWKPWAIAAAGMALCSLALPSASILCMVAASLVFVLTWSPSNASPTHFPDDAQGEQPCAWLESPRIDIAYLHLSCACTSRTLLMCRHTSSLCPMLCGICSVLLRSGCRGIPCHSHRLAETSPYLPKQPA